MRLRFVELHQYMFWEHEDNQAVRKGNWKAVKDYKMSDWELYNLSTDRAKENNAASRYPDVLKNLVTHWNEWSKKDFIFPKHKDANDKSATLNLCVHLR